MQNSNDLELSRRAVVLGGAASVALTTISTGTALAQSAQVVGPQLATIPVALEINGNVSGSLTEISKATNAEMRERMSGNICRCGAYSNILEAMTEVAGEPT